ncbi:MAG: mersacidin/lichenicidin family type 2 lantibiotic [Acidobacteriaceae bacterium]|nr:mersacidin/lichenicidin family type 2 lantibiotic [Acidobacteriaceae bacterium]MBV9225685.1 mersacidin/lichenicidin family type 2 lantibiotic [Acidobacteriaceae bacterium]MBV9675531.1 mersacidin/lichenicidin family type 2 lantibiotic [Acidobacteriaceae bacterium]
MKNVDVIRAWKDEDYRLSLNDFERALLPQHPSGLLELTDTELEGAAGGRWIPWPTLGFNCHTIVCSFLVTGC